MDDGHTITIFNCGVTSPELFPYVDKLRGFRSANLDGQNLADPGRRHRDVVIDVWPSDPVLAELLIRVIALNLSTTPLRRMAAIPLMASRNIHVSSRCG